MIPNLALNQKKLSRVNLILDSKETKVVSRMLMQLISKKKLLSLFSELQLTSQKVEVFLQIVDLQIFYSLKTNKNS